jgi:hypothetical protein
MGEPRAGSFSLWVAVHFVEFSCSHCVVGEVGWHVPEVDWIR